MGCLPFEWAWLQHSCKCTFLACCMMPTRAENQIGGGMSTEVIGCEETIEMSLLQPPGLIETALQFCLVLSHVYLPFSTRSIFVAMSTIQRASPARFSVAHNELAPFDLGEIVDYLKEVPTLFDLQQTNDVFCDPKNGK
jgi:hypothetical protein